MRRRKTQDVPQRVRDAQAFAARPSHQFRHGQIIPDTPGPLFDHPEMKRLLSGKRSTAYRIGQVLGALTVSLLVVALLALVVAIVAGAVVLVQAAL